MDGTMKWLDDYSFWVGVAAGVVGLMGLVLARWLSRRGGARPSGIVGRLSPRAHPVLASVVWAAVLLLVFSVTGGWGVHGGWPAVREEPLGAVTVPRWLVASTWAWIGSICTVLCIFLVPLVVKAAVRLLSRLRRRPLFPSLFAAPGEPRTAARWLNAVSTVALVGVSLLLAVLSARHMWVFDLVAESQNVCDAGDYDQALALVNEAIRIKPTYPHALRQRGNVRRARKEHDLAIADFTEVIRLRPTDSSAFSQRGYCWHEKEEHDKAIADYTEAIRLDSSRAVVFNNRGNAWYYKKEYDKAIADYTEAINLKPGDAGAFRSRGHAWHDKKEYDKAIADYTEAIRLDSSHAVVFNNRGSAWAEKKEYDKAIEDFTEAIQLNRGHASGSSTFI